MPNFDFVLSGRYRLVAPLGEGGMAAVYRARDLRLDREVAVKILREDLTRDPDFLARFNREAQIVARLSHHNIVPVYDVGSEEGTQFIVMEFIRGRTLKDLLDAGPLPAERAVAVMRQVLGALQYAHEHGLIHRDVKPQNILITGEGVVRLADFGIAHLTDASSTRTAAILGSAHYLSPEQARGDEASVQSDVYACGVVLYEMLTGQSPFSGSNALQIAHHHLHTPPSPLPGSIEGTLRQITMKALAKPSEERFASAAEFAHALKQVRNVEATAKLPLIEPARAAGSGAARSSTGATGLGATQSATTGASEPGYGLVLKRSGRRTTALAVFLGGLVALGAAIAFQQPGGLKLPAYPSAPYSLVIVVLAGIVATSWFANRSWTYTMDGNAAVVQWGVVSHNRFGIPLRQVTSLELKQSLVDRLLGVGTIELCARDHLGEERRLVMEDLARPRQTYEELMGMLGRAGRGAVQSMGPSE